MLVALFSLALANCGGGGGSSTTTPPPTSSPSTPPATLTAIAVSPQGTTVAAGLTKSFIATGTFTDGSSHALSAVSWSSSDTGKATIDGSGNAQTLKAGTVTISAAVGTINGSTTLNIGPAEPTGLVLSPANVTLNVGVPAPRFTAYISFTDGSTTDVSASTTWSISNTLVADIDSMGQTATHRRGLARISASAQGYSTTGDLTVVEVPRYVFASTDASRIVSRLTVDAPSGILRYTGYQQTFANGFAVFGCMTVDPLNEYAYVGATVNSSQPSDPKGELQVYAIDSATGALTPHPNSPFPETVAIGCIQFEPTGRFAYAVSSLNNTNNQVITFERDPATGVLRLTGSIPLAGPPSNITIDPLGQFAYVATYSLGTPTPALAYGFTIDVTTGGLTPVQGTPFQLSNAAGSFSFDPVGAHVYMANSNGNSIDIYNIDRATGKLTPGAASVAPCINPSAVQFHPTGKFAYTTCSMNNAHGANSASLVSFNVAANGALMQSNSAAIGDAPSAITISTDGKFAYAYALADSTYSSYRIGGDGRAIFVRKQGARANLNPPVMVGGTAAVQYKTKFAYAVGKTDNELRTYSVGSDGSLSFLGAQATAQTPTSINGLPWGADLLVSAIGHTEVAPYRIDRNTGTVTTGTSFTGPSGPATSALIDPSGRWAFADWSDSTSGLVTTYANNFPFWALLSYLPAGGSAYSSFTAGAGAGSMAIDPSGQFLYVANKDANSISGYRYSTSPQLIEATTQFTSPFTDGSPYSTQFSPIALAMDPSGSYLYVLCSDHAVRVYEVSYWSWGHLRLVATKSVPGPGTGIAVHPSNGAIYVTTSGGLVAFAANPQTGALTTIDLGTQGTLASATAVYVEPSGQWLYVTTPTDIYRFNVSADGTLAAVPFGNTPSNDVSGMTFITEIQ